MQDTILYTYALCEDGFEVYIKSENGRLEYTDDLGEALLVDSVEKLPEPVLNQCILTVKEDKGGWLRIIRRSTLNIIDSESPVNIMDWFV